MAMRLVILLIALAGANAALASVPFWGDRESMPFDTPAESLTPGQWLWAQSAAPAGPIVVVVALDDQRVDVYRNGVRIGVASASTGKPGHGTPTGVFQTLQKDATHRSSTYNNAPMPYQQRLTWDGVALHAGGLPGYPSSHGCVHLPSAFAEALFKASPLGMTVVVATSASAPVSVAHPPGLAPVDAVTGAPSLPERLGEEERFRWTPEASPEGPVSIIVSRADARAVVLRNGIEIGRTRLEVQDDQPFGTHAYVAQAGTAGKPAWIAVPVPGHIEEEGQVLAPEQVGRVRFPADFLARLTPLLQPGTSLVVTDHPMLPQSTAEDMTVVTNAPEVAAR
jgi:hypothetical protein